uniref:Uncharacterized protein n=1 Tax=Arundo donax TaxID=35708 RepID=A0A0A9T5W8_ARUDO
MGLTRTESTTSAPSSDVKGFAANAAATAASC